MAINYTYSHGSTANLDRLRYLLGDHRGVNGTYATSAAWNTSANALHCDEELNDLLAATMCNGDILSAARIAMQCRINREAMSAGVSGTTDTTDRPSALLNAINQLARLTYPLGDLLTASKVRTNLAIDTAGLSDMGDT